MAIYHLSVKPIQRSSGRSATAAAAYRAGCVIDDLRTGERHDYTSKAGVVVAVIVLPPDAPVWASDRADLWNAAEAAERRKDGTPAREYEVALPKEMDSKQRQRLALDFAREMAEREGCAVDVAIHAPSHGSDNHHAHILRTTRRVGPDGFGAKLKMESAGRNRKADLEAVRARWAELCNERLAAGGHSARIDHRTLIQQGVDRLPTVHMGPFISALEQRGIKTELGELNRDRTDKNKIIKSADDYFKTLIILNKRARTLDKQIASLRREIDIKPVRWTTLLLTVAQVVFEKASVALEKLMTWHELENKISAWRKEHTTRAKLRVGDGELVVLERQQADLGEVDHEAKVKFGNAQSALKYAEAVAHDEWIKKNSEDKLKIRKLARELDEINYFNNLPPDEAKYVGTNRSNYEEVRVMPSIEWRPLKRAHQGHRSVEAALNNKPTIEFNPSPRG